MIGLLLVIAVDHKGVNPLNVLAFKNFDPVDVVGPFEGETAGALNVATAGAVLLYELMRRAAGPQSRDLGPD